MIDWWKEYRLPITEIWDKFIIDKLSHTMIELSVWISVVRRVESLCPWRERRRKKSIIQASSINKASHSHLPSRFSIKDHFFWLGVPTQTTSKEEEDGDDFASDCDVCCGCLWLFQNIYILSNQYKSIMEEAEEEEGKKTKGWWY